MKRRLLTAIGLAAVVGAIGIGTVAAAGPGASTPGWSGRADCPYATSTSTTPLRIHAQDGTGQNARAGAQLHLQDGTGPHGPWAGGR